MDRKDDRSWDKENSTFMRTLFMANGYEFTGYSKKCDITLHDGTIKRRAERINKIELLTNWILRDYKGGYLDINSKNPRITKLDRSEIFMQVELHKWEPIVTLYYTFADWSNSIWFDNEPFGKWIAKFYNHIKAGTPKEMIIDALEAKHRAPRNKPFSTDTPRFRTVNDLNLYCQAIRNKYPNGEIMHFYKMYMEKYFNQNSTGS